VTDSERFYTSILELFDDVEEKNEIDDLLTWWNRYVCHCRSISYNSLLFSYSQIFPNYLSGGRAICKNTALARIRQKRMEQRAIADGSVSELGRDDFNLE